MNLPYGNFKAQLLGTRIIVTPTPRLAVSSLIQYNQSAHSLASSVRLRWEYAPGSEFFVVYTDGRGKLTNGPSELLSRSLAVKVTRLLRL